MTAPAGNPYRRYTIRNPRWRVVFQTMDAVLERAFPYTVPPPLPAPRRILLANAGHMGDVLMAASMLPVLKSAFPDAEMGFLSGSWSMPVLDGHPHVRWIHAVDHWKLNRRDISTSTKFAVHRRTVRSALREVRKVGYDTAIDLFYFFPNYVPLLWRTGIPVRIGYLSAGFGPLLTHPLGWVNSDCHMTDYHSKLLEVLPVRSSDLEKKRMWVPEADADRAAPILEKAGGPGNYIVFHMGTGAAMREWPLTKWRSLAGKFSGGPFRLVFTGAGAREQRNVREVVRGMPGCVNLCGILGWREFIEVIRHARLLFGVESLAGHLAAATGTPHVVIYSGTTNTRQMRPMGSGGIVLKHRMPCDPCHRAAGCETMDCVRNVTVEEVFEEGVGLIGAPFIPSRVEGIA